MKAVLVNLETIPRLAFSSASKALLSALFYSWAIHCAFSESDSVTKPCGTVTITTDNCFKNGKFLNLPAKHDPEGPYEFSVTATPAEGWKLARRRGNLSPISMDVSNQRGKVDVVSVKFETIKKRKDGTPDKTEVITMKVFVFWVDISPVTSGSIAPLDPEYSEHDNFVALAGSPNLGIRSPEELNGFVGGSIEIDGVVNPRVDGQTFGSKRILNAFLVYRNGDFYNAVIPGDDPSAVVDGTPSVTRRIYDADRPAVRPQAENFPNGTVFALRANYTQYFTLHDLVCSDKLQWHIERTARKTNNIWYDEGRNSIGAGVISTEP